MTFHALLAQRFARAEICPYPYMYQLAEVSDAQLAGYRYFGGHFVYPVARFLAGSQPVFATLLREPVERFISQFYFQQEKVQVAVRGPDSLRARFTRMSLDEFVQATDFVIHRQGVDVQAKMLGLDINAETLADLREALNRLDYSAPDNPLCAPANLALAKSRLELFAFIGLTERFQDALFLLAYTFGWPPITVYHSLNPTASRPSLQAINPALLARIANLNRADQVLYAHARSLFESRFEQMSLELLEHYGRAGHAHLELPLPVEVMVELLEAHYRQRFVERQPRLQSVAFSFEQAPSGVGWYAPDLDAAQAHPSVSHRWSGPGRRSSLDFHLETQADLALEFCVASSIQPDVFESLKLQVNGQPLPLIKAPVSGAEQTCSTLIPRSLLQRDTQLTRLVFEVARTLPANTLDASSTDDRPLGLAFNWLNIRSPGLAPGRRVLSMSQTHSLGDTWPQFKAILRQCRRQLGRQPAVLDWRTGLDLHKAFPAENIFTPLAVDSNNAGLPYLAHSIDVVVCPMDQEDEARRVASLALVTLSQNAGGQAEFELSWVSSQAAARPAPPSFSIIIPVYGQLAYTQSCLEQLRQTIAGDFACEIIVVDDASNDDTPAFLHQQAAQDLCLKILTNPQNTGFIASCNRAAQAASGEWLVFLNNDTLPQSGWLEAAWGTFEQHPDAGAVGAKLLYPDGRLQEAGAVIFADGSGANFGKWGDPGDPLYNYLRPVDYCSGAFLVTPRELFLQLGGFDPLYTPAYYEDADYCFRLRQAGYKVYYQPECVIVHVEGATSGVDPSSTFQGAKRYQIANREKFVHKWARALQVQPSPPAAFNMATWHALVAGPEPARRALLCAPSLPEYDRQSGSLRIFHFVQFLQEAGWAVSFVAHDERAEPRYTHQLRQMGVAVYTGFDQRMQQLVQFGRFELAILAFWKIAELALPIVRQFSPSTAIIVDSVDLHFLRQARQAFGSLQSAETGDERCRSATGLLEENYASQMVREINAYVAADVVLAVSDKESQLINDLVNDPGLAYTVPDSFSLYETDTPISVGLSLSQRKGILFVGNFRHPPNEQALAYLCQEIVPRLDPAVLAQHPIYVVGNALDERIQKLGSGLPDVHMLGWVPSLIPYLHSVRLSLVPLLFGAGTKRKLLHALMAGTPVVSTSIGVEGLDLQDGRHVLVRDDPEGFAQAIQALIQDDNLWQCLAQQGHAKALVMHGRPAVREIFLGAINRALARQNKPYRASINNLPVPREEFEQLKAVYTEARDYAYKLEREYNQLLNTYQEAKDYARNLEGQLHEIRVSCAGRIIFRLQYFWQRLRRLVGLR
ncbi:MAG: glycosyltransferase [Chloroflexota bacterium]